jgi:apolipoprotein N-acyltransferase
MRRGGVALPSLAAGVALTLSLPPFGWWPLAFVGAAVLYWRLAGLALRTRVLAGWLAGLGLFVPGLAWARAFNWYGAAVLMVVEALTMALAGGLVPPHRGRLVAFAGAFTLAEALRMAWPFGGLPISGVFLGQAGGPFLATARLGGPLLLTAVVWLGGGALGQLGIDGAVWWWRRSDAVGPGHRPIGTAVGAGLALVAVVAVGLAGAVAPDGGRAVRTIAVAAVQGGGRRGVGGPAVAPSSVIGPELSASRALTAGRAGPPGLDLVVWPEDVIALDGPLAGSAQARAVSGLAVRLRATVVAGVTVDRGTTFLNEAVAWGPNGRVVGTYEKVHRVPFGEYVPDRGLFSHLANLSGVPADAVPGRGTGLLRTPAGPLGVMISYEVFYADRGRSAVRAGAELLVVPTNTASYSSTQIPTQELAADRVQAVAEGRDLVQAATTGFSSVVDNRGDVRRHSALGVRQVVTATVALRRGATVYERWGDLPVLVLATVGLVVGWLLELADRRRRGSTPHRDPVRVAAPLHATGMAGPTTGPTHVRPIGQPFPGADDPLVAPAPVDRA